MPAIIGSFNSSDVIILYFPPFAKDSRSRREGSEGAQRQRPVDGKRKAPIPESYHDQKVFLTGDGGTDFIAMFGYNTITWCPGGEQRMNVKA